MRMLKRNERDFWFAKPLEVTETVDANGDYTGLPQITYTAPIYFKAVISPGRGYTGFGGSAHPATYGVDVDSERRIMTNDFTLGIDETCIIGQGTAETDEQGHALATSAIWSVNARPADGLNFLSIPVKVRSKNGSD